MANETRLILSVGESEALIAEHIALGERYAGGISEEEYARWHAGGKMILSRIFDTREIPKQFDGIGAGALSLSDTERREHASAAEKFGREMEFLFMLKGKLKSFRPVGRAVR